MPASRGAACTSRPHRSGRRGGRHQRDPCSTPCAACCESPTAPDSEAILPGLGAGAPSPLLGADEMQLYRLASPAAPRGGARGGVCLRGEGRLNYMAPSGWQPLRDRLGRQRGAEMLAVGSHDWPPSVPRPGGRGPAACALLLPLGGCGGRSEAVVGSGAPGPRPSTGRARRAPLGARRSQSAIALALLRARCGGRHRRRDGLHEPPRDAPPPARKIGRATAPTAAFASCCSTSTISSSSTTATAHPAGCAAAEVARAPDGRGPRLRPRGALRGGVRW